MITEKRLWIFIFFVITFLVAILAFTNSGQAALLISATNPPLQEASQDSVGWQPQPYPAQTTGKIEVGLLTALGENGRTDFIVRFVAQADLSTANSMDWNARGEFVYNSLHDVATKSQVNAKAILDAEGLNYQTFIAGNELYVWSGTQTNAIELAALPEVYFIRATRVYQVDPGLLVSNPILTANMGR